MNHDYTAKQRREAKIIHPVGAREDVFVPRRAIPATIDYTNYRGERKQISILPVEIYWGSTEFHPEPQWLLNALTSRDGQLVQRIYAMKDIHNFQR